MPGAPARPHNLLLAVSGGVDSMALLDILKPYQFLFLAHFDHGTRPSSADDADFVRSVAAELELPLFVETAKLGNHPSEATARAARYEFLFSCAGEITRRTGRPTYLCTAHHLDDLCESVAINFARGTGWRGLTPFFDSRIRRPFLNPETPTDRTNILVYAANRQLKFRLDPTNSEDSYLRNRLRPRVRQLPLSTKQAIFRLWCRQTELRHTLEHDLRRYAPEGTYHFDPAQNFLDPHPCFPRDFFRHTPDDLALETLRLIFENHNLRLTRPQLTEALVAIRTYCSGKKFNLPGDQFITFTKHDFYLPSSDPLAPQLKTC